MNYFTKAKPYNSLSEYYRQKCGHKMAKISLNAGFSCPNRDGRKGYGGCTYCSKSGSGDFAGSPEKKLSEQFQDIRSIMENKWPEAAFIAYLQAGSNTYGDLCKLRAVYGEVLALPEIKGIDIATRADCIDPDTALLLSEVNEKCPLTVELGLQSANEETGMRINRCMSNAEFETAVRLLRSHHIDIVVHIINGLPGETEEDMLNTIRYVNGQDIQGIKIHSLLILKGTRLYEEYLENPFPILSLEEYTRVTCKQIALLREDIIIHRLAADGVSEDVVEPQWTKKKLVVMNEIDKYLRKNGMHQGMDYGK